MSGFSFNFDKNIKDAPDFTTKDQVRLREITMRISGVKAAAERGANLTEQNLLDGEREVIRLEAAFKDVMKRLTKEEKAEYKAIMKARLPKPLTKEQQAARLKQMDTNRDRPSH